MTETARTPSSPSSPGLRPKRGEGQWALGYNEPLNSNEQSKKDDDPLNVRDRIINIYSHRGFDAIDPADLRGRFRWMGIYTQRRPGLDGGNTGALEALSGYDAWATGLRRVAPGEDARSGRWSGSNKTECGIHQ